MNLENRQGMITGIRLQNFKAFRDTGWIEFNRFTLLYGYNSNGKSTILRFLYQLKRCINEYRSGRDTTLWNDDVESQEGGYLDLLYNGSEKNTEEMSFSFKISLRDSVFSSIKSTLQKSALKISNEWNLRPEIIYTVSYKYGKAKKKIDLRQISISCGDFLLYQYVTTHTGLYRMYSNFSKSVFPGQSEPLWNTRNTFVLEDKVQFMTMNHEYSISNSLASKRWNVLTVLQNVKSIINSTLVNYTDDFEYFFPTRNMPGRIIQLNKEDASRVGAMGENTYKVLFNIEMRRDTEKKKKINQYLELFGYHYEWRMLQIGYGEFLLKDLKTGIKVNICDCGFGISQILPIIVSCFDDSKAPLAIDSPDAHLHGKVHGDICDLLIETSKRRPVIIETHSENLLLRLQRRIVEKNDIYPDLATVYFITDDQDETVCKKISFNEYGDLVDEPEEFKVFFSAAFEDIMSITKAKGERMRDNNAFGN